MKRIYLLVLLLVLPITAMAQAKIQTKRYIISDLPQKSMKVVLTGNEIFDIAYRECIHEIWHLGPYEFCDAKEFESLKKSADYYFLALTETRQEQEEKAGIRSLVLFKGKDTAAQGFDGLYKVASLPFCAADGTDGKELEVMPVLLSYFQEEVGRMMKSPVNLSSNIGAQTRFGGSKWNSSIYVDRDDLAFEPGTSLTAVYADENIHFVDFKKYMDILANCPDDGLVCYVVAPFFPTEGAVSYTMILDIRKRQILYLQNHKITPSSPRGVLQKEMKTLISRN